MPFVSSLKIRRSYLSRRVSFPIIARRYGQDKGYPLFPKKSAWKLTGCAAHRTVLANGTMKKAFAVIPFKLEEQSILENPGYEMRKWRWH